jgi:hypothetical protein
MISSITLSLIALNFCLISMLYTAPLPPSPPPPPSSCSDELVLVSPCMPYVSFPPNNLSENCCDAISSSALNSTNGVCLCHLARQPSKSPTQSFLVCLDLFLLKLFFFFFFSIDFLDKLCSFFWKENQ